MTMGYIRKTYDVPAKRGMRVIANGRPGVITSSRGPHLMIRLDGHKNPLPYHPTENIKYDDLSPIFSEWHAEQNK